MNLMDPRIAELDLLALSAIPRYKEGKEPPELKHLSRGRNRNQKRFR